MFVTFVLAAIASRRAFAPTVSAATSPASTFDPPRAGRVLVQLNPHQSLEGWLWSKLPGMFLSRMTFEIGCSFCRAEWSGVEILEPNRKLTFPFPLLKNPKEYFVQHATTPA